MDNKIIYDLIKEVRDDIKGEKEDSIKWRAETSSRLLIIEEDLREHKEGVIQNRGVLAKQDKRIEILEEPGKTRTILYKKSMTIFKFIAAAGAACAALGKYLEWF